MGEKLVVGPINRGQKTDREPFVIDNDSFPVLQNAYQWRGRIKRKRGTTKLGQLNRYIDTDSLTWTEGVQVTQVLNGSGEGNLLTGFVGLTFEAHANLVLGSISITDIGTLTVYTDGSDGVLYDGAVVVGTINYQSGAFTIASIPGATVVAAFQYYPFLPVMGIEEMQINPSADVGCMAFDTTYSYLIKTTTPYPIHDVSFYKNPTTATYNLYVQKTWNTLLTWNGQDYQQFWTTNYAGAIWATNGVNVPFSVNSLGMQFAPTVDITYTANTATTLSLTIANCPLVIGDFVFANEWGGVNQAGLNFQTGYVTACAPNTSALAIKNVVITFPNATLTAGPFTPGIIQYLTTRNDPTRDCIRWFDGDATDGSIPPLFNTINGWVNYCPPLSQSAYSIANLPAAQYYLVGARMIVPFKDRLLFLGPVVQTSTAGSQAYLHDTIIYTQNGTPYYTCSYTNNPITVPPTDVPTSVAITFNPILVPANQTATAPALFEDQIGFGGFISAGVNEPINSVGSNEDALIVGFSKFQTRVISTGNDAGAAFEFFIINSELGTASTFSTVNLDQGVLSRGSRGFIITSQTSTQRFDLDVIDQVFQINLENNGNERFTSQRDFQNEWVYFTYKSDQSDWKYPNQTLFYNYRDNSFAVFNESYTTYGQFTETSGQTWADLNYFDWDEWNTPWNFGDNNIFQPIVLGGNQQGYIMVRETARTGEGPSLTINGISGSTITSYQHNLNEGDFILIYGVLGTNTSQVNGRIFQVNNATDDTFELSPNIGTINYLGGGQITRMYVPFIQTKQFPSAWGIARKSRIGPQQYLLSSTDRGQITVQIYLSQDSSSIWNSPPIFPAPSPSNNSLIYDQIVLTCPESTNLGLTPFNTNLLNLTVPGESAGSNVSNSQQQIWHRMNTSLIGDTIQLGFTMSYDQMTAVVPSGTTFTITGATNTSQCTLTAVNSLDGNELIRITDVVGMTQLNGRTALVVDATPTTITININSTAFTPYVSGGTVNVLTFPNQFEEIELHGFILDISPSQLLA